MKIHSQGVPKCSRQDFGFCENVTLCSVSQIYHILDVLKMVEAG